MYPPNTEKDLAAEFKLSQEGIKVDLKLSHTNLEWAFLSSIRVLKWASKSVKPDLKSITDILYFTLLFSKFSHNCGGSHIVRTASSIDTPERRMRIIAISTVHLATSFALLGSYIPLLTSVIQSRRKFSDTAKGTADHAAVETYTKDAAGHTPETYNHGRSHPSVTPLFRRFLPTQRLVTINFFSPQLLVATTLCHLPQQSNPRLPAHSTTPDSPEAVARANLPQGQFAIRR
ncbi:hypothetical protein VC83_01016 [Pseudogymnoascus destructans]|uniref:Uncharacterized protein n=1 Tax=Pseudogymnoascus destructans TaxID=655981 RepID=A0A177AJF1_9PEZI|nr:uncharacterized protein VC83_01016 [Pseudogymnoascus destructans]OAF62188.1 hypothetical protein VC83_01016 [Pseudogymnoascus destructans]